MRPSLDAPVSEDVEMVMSEQSPEIGELGRSEKVQRRRFTKPRQVAKTVALTLSEEQGEGSKTPQGYRVIRPPPLKLSAPKQAQGRTAHLTSSGEPMQVDKTESALGDRSLPTTSDTLV